MKAILLLALFAVATIAAAQVPYDPDNRQATEIDADGGSHQVNLKTHGCRAHHHHIIR